jgi:hypothetical protein
MVVVGPDREQRRDLAPEGAVAIAKRMSKRGVFPLFDAVRLPRAPHHLLLVSRDRIRSRTTAYRDR